MQSGPTSGDELGAQNGPTVAASAWGYPMFGGQTWDARDSGGKDANGGQVRANSVAVSHESDLDTTDDFGDIGEHVA